MARIERTQQGGDFSKNYQAAGDIVLHQGISYMEARTIAMDVFSAALPQLQAEARAVAEERAAKITDEFLAGLDSQQDDTFDALANPDIQVSLSEAQKGYARTGDEDLKESLVELLVHRVGEKTGSLRSIALNEAITSTPKLTEEQRHAIAWVFFIRHTRPMNPGNPAGLYQLLQTVAYELSGILPSSREDYLHIEYVGAGTVSVMEFDFVSSIIAGVESLFTEGFTRDDVGDQIWKPLEENSLLLPCFRRSDNYQLNILGPRSIPERLGEAGLSHLQDEVQRIMQIGMMDSHSIKADLLEHVPGLHDVASAWNNSNTGLKNLTLTSVGIALGYAYWQRNTTEEVALSRWL